MVRISSSRSRDAIALAVTPPAAAMTSPASTTSWFSGIARTASGKPSSSAMPPGGGVVASAPASLSDAPAAVGGKAGVVSTVAASAGVGGRRKQLQGTLFKYGPKSAQDKSVANGHQLQASSFDNGLHVDEVNPTRAMKLGQRQEGDGKEVALCSLTGYPAPTCPSATGDR